MVVGSTSLIGSVFSVVVSGNADVEDDVGSEDDVGKEDVVWAKAPITPKQKHRIASTMLFLMA